MKFKIIYFAIISLFIIMVLQSASQGVGNRFNQDRTGGPVASSTCSACHSGGNFNAMLSAVVTDAGGNVVTTYIPGQAYTVTFTVSSNSTTASKAFQGVALNSTNGSTGTWSNPQTGVRLSSVSGRQYVEHSSPKTGGANVTFVATWTAPASGTGNVTFYAAGVVANRNGSTSGDQPTSGISLTLTEQQSTTISYPQTAYCTSDNDPTPTVTGTTGGSYAASPAGLSISPNTGTIDLDNSSPGSYTITYTYSGGTTTANVTVNAASNAGFSYSRNSYCINASNATPTIFGTTGTFTASPSGLSISGNTGTIDVSNSNIGTYTITHIVSGACPDTSIAVVSISVLDNAGFSYGSNSYCSNDNDPTPNVTGFFGGSFSATPTGLNINPNSGLIDVSASTAGSYMVTYSTNGNCPNDSTVMITINAADDATFSYTNVNNCGNDTTTYFPTITGLSGGTFSQQGTGFTVNPTTGALNFQNTPTGNYAIIYTTNGTCPSTSSFPIFVNAADSATINYTNTPYCTNEGDPTPTLTGVTGGVFSSILRNPTTTIVLDTMTGTIDLSLSSAGVYDIVYTTNGICPTTDTATVTITQADIAFYSYTDTSMCANGNSNPTLSATSNFNGIYTTSSTDLVLVDSTTGEIDLQTSAPGRYVLSFTTVGPCPTTTSVNVELFLCGNVSTITAENAYQLYPNPNNGQFQIKNNSLEEETTIIVRDLYGKVIYHQAGSIATNDEISIQLPEFATGMYIVEIQSQKGMQSFKVVID